MLGDIMGEEGRAAWWEEEDDNELRLPAEVRLFRGTSCTPVLFATYIISQFEWRGRRFSDILK